MSPNSPLPPTRQLVLDAPQGTSSNHHGPMAFDTPTARRTLAIVGGGFSGSLLALKLVALRPDWRVVLIDPSSRPGRGLAYGACAPSHLLNVPVARMEAGLSPAYGDWLAGRAEMAEALAESGGEMSAAFSPRELWGQYLQQQVAAARVTDNGAGLTVLRGEAVRLLDAPRRGLVLGDGREVEADTVVLATGNLPPRPPLPADSWLRDAAAFAADPWAADALTGIAPDAPVLLLGTGLTMVDIALKLAEEGHRGRMLAVSRRGLLPGAHRYGGPLGAVPGAYAARGPADPVEGHPRGGEARRGRRPAVAAGDRRRAAGDRPHLVDLDAGPEAPVSAPPASALGRPPPPHGAAHCRADRGPDGRRPAQRPCRPR
jgi:hypothetical protein